MPGPRYTPGSRPLRLFRRALGPALRPLFAPLFSPRPAALFAALALALCLGLGPACAQSGQAGAAASGQSALNLWTPAQLARPHDPDQAAAERRIRPLGKPDLTGPGLHSAPQSAGVATLPVVSPSGPPAGIIPTGIIRRVRLAEGDRRIALTFDLCERAIHTTGYDAELVDALRAANARATFFAGGKWMRSHPERTQQLMADPRFELGSHAWTHANMLVATPAEQERQILWTNEQFNLLRAELAKRLASLSAPSPSLPGPFTLFRLPYGRGNAETAQRLNQHNLAVIQWDVVGEGGGGSAEQRAQGIVDSLRPGSIILLHANAIPKDTADIVRHLLPLLAKHHYTTATISELLRAGTPETSTNGYFTTPGDNQQYDRMFLGHGTLGRAR